MRPPGLFGHAIDLGSVVAWSSGVAGSSHTLYQVCWRSGVWCCKPFGYGPYCLHPSGCPMDISAVGLSVECTLQKVTLDSVGEVHYQAVGQSGNFTVAQVALVRARIFLALMFGFFFLPSVRQERGAGGSVTGYVSTRDLLTFYTARSKPISYMLKGEISMLFSKTDQTGHHCHQEVQVSACIVRELEDWI